MNTRPKDFTRRDALCVALAATAVELKLPRAIEMAAKVCRPLFESTPPGNWFPVIDPTHARAIIVYAGRMFTNGAFTRGEYDFVCDKARRAIVRGLPTRKMEIIDGQGRAHIATSAAPDTFNFIA